MPDVKIPKKFAKRKKLIAVPESEYRNLLKIAQARNEELAEVLEIVERAESDYKTGKTRIITSTDQLDEL